VYTELVTGSLSQNPLWSQQLCTGGCSREATMQAR
jgi:hypothetical protein